MEYLNGLRKALVRRLFGAKITIVYKNGAKVHFKAYKFSFKFDESGRKVTWEACWPAPMYVNVDEIDAIYNGYA